MTEQNLDRLLRARLERLASAVPMAEPVEETAAVGPHRIVRGPAVRASGFPGRLALASVLVAIMAVALWAGGVTLQPGPGGSASPIAAASLNATAAEAPTDIASDGTFELAISASRARYSALEPIDIRASLTYRGPLSAIEIFHAQGADGGPMGFGIDEPVIGDLLLGPGWRASCERSMLDAGAPLVAAFQKSGGWSSDHPRADEYREFMSDSELRLPAGTWHVYAVADLYLGACGGEHHELRAGITIVVGDETALPSEAPPPTRPLADVALPYPDGCPAYNLSERRCAFIVERAMVQAGLTDDEIDRIELLGDPDCVDPGSGLCNTSAGSTFLVRIRLITDAGAPIEQTLRCMLGSGFPCTEDQGLVVSSVTGPNGGYWDTPCNPGPAPLGCATPMPSIDSAAAAGAMPLQIEGLDIPIDRLGEYRIELGTAKLPNGQLSEASVQSVSAEGWVVVDRFLQLTVTSEDPSRPPFENTHQHGWYPGVEDVSVALEFTILQFDPGAVISIADVLVR